MTRVRHIAALSAACLLIALGAPRADAEPTVRNDAPGSITAVSVTPGTGRAEVVIAVEGPIDLYKNSPYSSFENIYDWSLVG